MTNAKSKPSGYGIHDKLTSVEMNIVDTGLVNSLDGSGGGTYSLSAPLTVNNGFVTIGGTGALSVTGSGGFSVTAAAGTAIFQCPVTLGGSALSVITSGSELRWLAGSTLTCQANNAQFSCPVNLGGATNVQSGGGLTILSGGAFTAAAGSTIEFDSAPTFKNGASFNTAGTVGFAVPAQFAGGITSAVTFSGGTVTFSDAIAANANITVTGATLQIDGGSKLQFAGSGHMRLRYVFGADANTTYSISDTDVILTRSSDLSADRNYTLSNTGCTGGEIIYVRNESTTRGLHIFQHDGSTLNAIVKQVSILTAGTFPSLIFINDGLGNAASSWHVLGVGGPVP